MPRIDLDETVLRKSARSRDPATVKWFSELVASRGSDFVVKKFSGIHYYHLERFDEARRLLEEALACDGSDIEVLLYLMRLHHRNAEAEQAGRAAGLIVERDPDNIEALRMLARVAYAAKDFERAITLWRRLAERAPDDREAPLQIARLAWRLEDYETAQHYAGTVLAVAPDNQESLDIGVKALHRLGHYDEMAALLPRYARAGWAEAVRFLDALEAAEATRPLADALAVMVRLEPPLPEAVEWAAKIEFRWLADAVAAELRGDDIGAAALYRAVLTVRPGNREALSSMSRLKAPVAKALREAQNDNQGDAIVAAANRLLTLDPASAEAEFALGRLHLVAGRPEEALAHLRRAAEGADSTVWYHLNHGRAALSCKCYDEALDAFVLILHSDTAPTHAYFVEAQKSLERICRQAVARARRLLADREFKEAYRLLAVADRTKVADGETTTLRATLERRMYSDVSSVYKNEPEAARAAVEAFLGLFPDNQKAIVMHGRLAMRERDYESALRGWQRLAALAPGSAECHLQIARCHSWLRSPQAAIEAAREALRFDPDLLEARAIIDRCTAERGHRAERE